MDNRRIHVVIADGINKPWLVEPQCVIGRDHLAQVDTAAQLIHINRLTTGRHRPPPPRLREYIIRPCHRYKYAGLSARCDGDEKRTATQLYFRRCTTACLLPRLGKIARSQWLIVSEVWDENLGRQDGFYRDPVDLRGVWGAGRLAS